MGSIEKFALGALTLCVCLVFMGILTSIIGSAVLGNPPSTSLFLLGAVLTFVGILLFLGVLASN